MPRFRIPTRLALLGLAGLAGCVSIFPKTTPAQLYRFGSALPPAASAPANGPAPAKIGLALESLQFTRAALSDGILTVTGDRTAYIAGVRWVAPARVLFQEAAQQEFESRTTRVQLVQVGDPGAGAYLRLDVSAFEVDYGRSGPVVRVALNARLTGADGRLLDQRNFSVSEPAAPDTISSIVAAFDRATGTILGDVGTWADDTVAAHPPAAAAPQPSPPPASAPSPAPAPASAPAPAPAPGANREAAYGIR